MDLVDNEKWIRIFDITDTTKHSKGFVIYKVISMLYPEKCPEAITKLTVWKRYNDFKSLNREMKILHAKYGIADKFPVLPRGTVFKKYNQGALLEKKQSALNFLEYIGNHHQLFTSKQFIKFFESSYTPSDQPNGNISSIKADLNLPDDPEFLKNSEDEKTSDTDSVSTQHSINPNISILDSSAIACSTSGHSRKFSQKSSSISSEAVDNQDTCSIESLTLLDGQVYSSPPRSTDCDETYVQYIIDASVHVKLAEELENSEKYEESLVAYKTAIDILLTYGKTEKNYDRKRLVKYKTEKYLLRAEKLYNMYLSPEVRNLKTIFRQSEKKEVESKPPMSNLYKYNVVRIIDSGMLVTHSDTQQLFYVKVVHKTIKFLDDNLVLPEDVPYMVRLHNYFNCDNALFLVLEYVNGWKLPDYLKKIRNKCEERKSCENIFDTVNYNISDDESEKSFSDLINDYTKAKTQNNDDSDGSFEKISKNDLVNNFSVNLIDQPIPEYFNKKVECFTNSETGHLEISQHKSCMLLSNLQTMKDETEKDELEHEVIVKWAAQLILALEKLHVLGVSCKNLRSHNLIIDEKGDLNLTYMCNIKELCDIFNNTYDSNVAPEVQGIGPVGQEADWWSLGAILYEILVGMDLNDVHPQFFSASSILKVPKFVAPEARSLLRQLLVYEPKNRLGVGPHGIDNLKSHPFFKGVDWHRLIEMRFS